MSALCWTLKRDADGVRDWLLRTGFDASEPRCRLPLLCPLLFRECPEWPVPSGRHGVLWCLVPRPYHCSRVVSRAVLVPQPGCSSRGPVHQYAWRGGVFDRCGDSHCGRSHERVRREAPITSPHDLRLGKVLSFCHRFQRSESHAQITNRDERSSRSVREELLWRR